MGKKTYIGVSSKARKVKKAYIGIDGKARKIKKMYIGVNGKAQCIFGGIDYPFTGLIASRCYEVQSGYSQSGPTYTTKFGLRVWTRSDSTLKSIFSTYTGHENDYSEQLGDGKTGSTRWSISKDGQYLYTWQSKVIYKYNGTDYTEYFTIPDEKSLASTLGVYTIVMSDYGYDEERLRSMENSWGALDEEGDWFVLPVSMKTVSGDDLRYLTLIFFKNNGTTFVYDHYLKTDITGTYFYGMGASEDLSYICLFNASYRTVKLYHGSPVGEYSCIKSGTSPSALVNCAQFTKNNQYTLLGDPNYTTAFQNASNSIAASIFYLNGATVTRLAQISGGNGGAFAFASTTDAENLYVSRYDDASSGSSDTNPNDGIYCYKTNGASVTYLGIYKSASTYGKYMITDLTDDKGYAIMSHGSAQTACLAVPTFDSNGLLTGATSKATWTAGLSSTGSPYLSPMSRFINPTS